MLTHDAVASIANDVLGRTLGAFGFERVDVTDDIESDGDEALQVIAHFRTGSKPADGSSSLKALSQLRETLQHAGEARFPLLRYDYPDDEVPYATDEDFDAWH